MSVQRDPLRAVCLFSEILSFLKFFLRRSNFGRVAALKVISTELRREHIHIHIMSRCRFVVG